LRSSALINYALYQAGWFACVLGGAWQWPWTGFGIGLILLLAQIGISTDRGRDARLIAITVAVGLGVEVIQIAAGTYSFSSGTFIAAFPPAWMLMLWAQFAATFAFSLKPIIARPVAAAAFGAVGGPIAFIAGDGLGAVTLLPPMTTGLLLLALSWGVAMTLLSAIARRELSAVGPEANPGNGTARPRTNDLGV
jgi:hypothetical protein